MLYLYSSYACMLYPLIHERILTPHPQGHSHMPWSLKYHPRNNNICASGCLGGQVRIWDIELERCTHVAQLPAPVKSVAFVTDGSALAIAAGSAVYLWRWGEYSRYS